MSFKDKLADFGAIGLVLFYLGMILAYFLAPIAFMGALLYVAIHFIHKVW